MVGGLAVRANLLCVAHTSSRGRVFLFDIEARRAMSRWDMPAAPGGYSDAGGVAMDHRFQIFVADAQNGRVRRFSAFGRHLGDIGQPPEPGGDAQRDRNGTLDHPHAVAVLGEEVLVACGERALRRGVQRFRLDGELQKPLLPEGDPEGWFGAPRGVWADQLGILVADTLHGRVQRFRPDGRFIASFATGAGSDDTSRPMAVARSAGGEVLVVDHGDRAGLRLFTAAGVRCDPPPDLAEHCDGILALTVDPQGRLYVLDREGERVLRFAPDLRFDSVLVDLAEHLDVDGL